MNFWQNDPVTGLPSVSLTLALFATLALTVSGVLNMYGTIQTVGPFTEMFYSGWALYFGRRFNVNGKVFSSDKAEEIKEKVE
jgi:hypothetical protein